MASKWEKKGSPKQGMFIPTNVDKVILVENQQNKGTIIYRSSWERIFMSWCDRNPSVLRWASEPFAIPYIKPTDFREHKYYIDFYFEARTTSGGIKKYIVEVKPKAETEPPKMPKAKTEKAMMNYEKRIVTYQVNQAKWDAARQFCRVNGLEFVIITEEELGI
jgi:hypothetical protein